MTTFEECKIFWSWGNHDLDYYKAYVGFGAITEAEYKAITGEDYVAPKS
ncbi:XkdX family protein [Pediococcus acidilactici]|uniref:XkdX family protein n=1 Tax=Pediococcus acidilactici TaxID=1254 RepID=A0AAW8YHH2_PEDAC|nr:XkdX family protein [Pediococcus acidilactici]MDV2621148.1 XkdX family protein [Pediococcus acidilactici]